MGYQIGFFQRFSTYFSAFLENVKYSYKNKLNSIESRNRYNKALKATETIFKKSVDIRPHF